MIKVPNVEILEQLIDGHQSLIACLNRTFDNLKLLDKKQIEIMREKRKTYEQIVKMNMNELRSIYDKRVFNNMVEGKIVILENTITNNFIVETFKRERNRFVIPEHRYINQLAGHRLFENSIIKEQQIFGFVSSLFIRLVL